MAAAPDTPEDDTSEGEAALPLDALVRDEHPGWRSRPRPETDLERRLDEARELYGVDFEVDPDLTGVSGDHGAEASRAVAEAIDAQATSVRHALEAHGDEDALAALEAVLDLGLLDRDLLEERARRRLEMLAGVQEGLSKLRSIHSVTEIVERAPRELVHSCGFDRAVVFRVHEGRMAMEAAYFDGDEQGAAKMVEFAQSVAPRLDHMLLETEMIRRHAPAIVHDARNDPRANPEIIRFSLTRAYVAAPIMPTGKVIGFLHADRLYSGRPVDTIDRDTVWAFAEGFGYAFERTVLLERMRRQHNEVRNALAGADAAMRGLIDAELDLRTAEPAARPDRPSATRVLAADDEESRIHAMLTRREIEVLRLMAAGRTNQQIAEELVISTGTVKSHVKRVLRKLRATNRAEAASRYVRLAQRRPPSEYDG